jgi:RHS repeat-associated protein
MQRSFAYYITYPAATTVRRDVSNEISCDDNNPYVANSTIYEVEDPDQLRTLLTNELAMTHNGYLHIYVSNGSSKGVNFNDFLITTARGKTRQINDYGSDCAKAPSIAYGLAIAGIHSDRNEYLNKYTAKELQSGDFDPSLGTGLEMFDFHARFYDPQLGRWFTPDPAEQFSNPYLAMGNNPVMYVYPDGEWIGLANLIFSAVLSGVQSAHSGGKFSSRFALGMLTGGIGLGINALGLPPMASNLLGGVADIGAASFINSISGEPINSNALIQSLAINSARSFVNVLSSTDASSTYTDYETFGKDSNGHFEITNHRVYSHTWRITRNYNFIGWTTAGLGNRPNFQPNNYRAVVTISQYLNPNFSLTSSRQLSVDYSQPLSIDAVEYSDARNVPRADFNLDTELNLDGHQNPIFRKSLQKTREYIHGKGLGWESLGEATYILPSNGVAQIRLTGAWSHNVGGSAVSPIRGVGWHNPFETIGIKDLITIPKFY